MVAIVQPLDLRTIFVNYFAGDMTYFVVVAMVVLIIMAAKYGMTGRVFLMLAAVFIVFMAGVAGGAMQAFYVVFLIGAGVVAYWIISRLFKS